MFMKTQAQNGTRDNYEGERGCRVYGGPHGGVSINIEMCALFLQSGRFSDLPREAREREPRARLVFYTLLFYTFFKT